MCIWRKYTINAVPNLDFTYIYDSFLKFKASYPFLLSKQNQLRHGFIGASPSNPINEIIVIETGVDLTLNCDRYFGPNGGILVEHGARLTIDGATLTSANTVNSVSDRWKGITVLGCDDVTDQPSPGYVLTGDVTTTSQGVAIFTNGATIENATIGVVTPSSFNAANLTSNSDLDEYDGSIDTRGGIVITQGGVVARTIQFKSLNYMILYKIKNIYLIVFGQKTIVLNKTIIHSMLLIKYKY